MNVVQLVYDADMSTIHLVEGAGRGDVPKVDVLDLAPTVRAYNVLRKMGVCDLTDLGRVSVSDLLSAKNCGVITAADDQGSDCGRDGKGSEGWGMKRFALLACWMLIWAGVVVGVLAGRWESGIPGR